MEGVIQEEAVSVVRSLQGWDGGFSPKGSFMGVTKKCNLT